MAKKKKTTKRKTASKKNAPAASPNTFWPIAGAIILFVVAFFLLMGSFNTGGSLPVSLFNGVEWAFGYLAYLMAAVLVVLGVWKISGEGHKIPLQEFTSIAGFLMITAAWLHVTFSHRADLAEESAGGAIGKLFGDMTLSALDPVPAGVLLAVLSFLLVALAFRISLKSVVDRIASLFVRQTEPEAGGKSLAQKAQERGLKLEQGVPVEDYAPSSQHLKNKDPSVRLSTLKNTASQLTPTESHQALTVASDPNWEFPSVSMLNQKVDKADAGDVTGNADIIRETMGNFNIAVEMVGANIGPRVTQFTLKPPHGVKLTKITALETNLSLDLAAESIRIEAPIPRTQLVGVEVPNRRQATVRLSSVLSSKQWKDIKGTLGFALGKDIAGAPMAGDLTKMPHLLVAGQTGSGKSVMINSLLVSLLYRNSPSDLKLILVDPKHVELKTYDDIPHLLTPVITEPEKCISALKWAVAEMERRLRAMAEVNTSNIAEYNELKKEEGMPYIVIVIDELADLMMMAARDVEALIARIAQKARAAGIHLVLATQRPSVNVITGLIKANIPGRIAFTTQSQVDSRTILDQGGAEKLLGSGDMLFLTSDKPKPVRVQGAFIDKPEVVKVTDFLRKQSEPQYDDEVVSQVVQLNGRGGIVADYGANEADDDMFKDAVRAVVHEGKASTSMLQRKLRIGYGRAARLIETMEEKGIVGPADGSRPREVLVASAEDVFNPPAVPLSGGDVYDDMPDDV
jgi:DNA segregation ATPase FtsK/SpoIIIE, S-DNA-T family